MGKRKIEHTPPLALIPAWTARKTRRRKHELSAHRLPGAMASASAPNRCSGSHGIDMEVGVSYPAVSVHLLMGFLVQFIIDASKFI
jgi:hypothetical protein